MIGAAATLAALAAAALLVASCSDSGSSAPSGIGPGTVTKVRQAAEQVRDACEALTTSTRPDAKDRRRAMADCMADVEDTVTRVRYQCIVATTRLKAGPERDAAIEACKDAAAGPR